MKGWGRGSQSPPRPWPLSPVQASGSPGTLRHVYLASSPLCHPGIRVSRAQRVGRGFIVTSSGGSSPISEPCKMGCSLWPDLSSGAYRRIQRSLKMSLHAAHTSRYGLVTTAHPEALARHKAFESALWPWSQTGERVPISRSRPGSQSGILHRGRQSRQQLC